MVLRIHVGLNFENKGRKLLGHGVYGAFFSFTRLRLGSQFKKFFQEGFDAEVGHCRAEEHGCQSSVFDFLHVKSITGSIQEFNIID